MANDGTTRGIVNYTSKDYESIMNDFTEIVPKLTKENICILSEFKGIDYAGVYIVTDDGRVYSIRRTIIDSIGRHLTFGGKWLVPQIDEDGYLYVHMTSNHKGYNNLIHQLVAHCFIPNISNLPSINHIDGNKQNNNVNNLEWCTSRYNTRHAIISGLTTAVFLIPVKCKQYDDSWKYFDCIRDAERYYDIEDNYLNKAFHIKKQFKGITVRAAEDASNDHYLDSFEKKASIPSKLRIKCIEDEVEFETEQLAGSYYNVTGSAISYALHKNNGYIRSINKTFSVMEV